jgi:hypothetical protein
MSERLDAILEKCPENEPIMIQAWGDCLFWAMKEDEFIGQFAQSDEEKALPPIATSNIGKMIDASSGVDAARAMAFVDWFNRNIWSDMGKATKEVLSRIPAAPPNNQTSSQSAKAGKAARA